MMEPFQGVTDLAYSQDSAVSSDVLKTCLNHYLLHDDLLDVSQGHQYSAQRGILVASSDGFRNRMSKTRVIGTTLSAIASAEKELNRTFPTSFSRWLLANNGRSLGGLVVFPVFDSRDPRKTWDSIVRNYTAGWQAWLENFSQSPERFAPLLPFAEFGTGDYYCFDYDARGASGEPAVVLWDHETGSARRVADDFEQWLSSVDPAP